MTYKLCEFWGPWLPTILSIIGAIIAIWQAIIAKKANKTQVFIERRQSIQKIYEEIWQWAEDIEHNPSTDDKCIYAMEKCPFIFQAKELISQCVKRQEL